MLAPLFESLNYRLRNSKGLYIVSKDGIDLISYFSKQKALNFVSQHYIYTYQITN